MGILFGADDVLDIAIEIERNGAAFYRKAAANTGDGDARRELLDLAAMEDTHEITFTELKRVFLAQEGAWAPPAADNEALLYVRSFASGQVFDMTTNPADVLTPSTTLPEVLRLALERERDSVAFFLGIKALMPAQAGGDEVEAIIRQEMGHIALLSRRLAEAA